MTLRIALAKMSPFSFLTSKHCHSNTVNVLSHVSATSVPPVRDFRISPEKVDLKHEFEKCMRESNKYKKKIFWKVKS